MTTPSTPGRLAACAFLPLITGCATIGTRPGAYEDRQVDTAERYVPLHRQTVSVKQDGISVDLSADQACQRQKFRIVERTHRDERFNQTPAVDYAFGVLGAGLVIAGTAFLADSGAAGIGTGAVMLLVPTVDAVRSAGTEPRVTQEEIPGDVLDRSVPCPRKPLAQQAVEIRLGNRRTAAVFRHMPTRAIPQPPGPRLGGASTWSPPVSTPGPTVVPPRHASGTRQETRTASSTAKPPKAYSCHSGATTPAGCVPSGMNDAVCCPN